MAEALSDDAIRAAASAIAAKLDMALGNPALRSIILTRDEAVLTLAMLNELVEQIGKERGSR